MVDLKCIKIRELQREKDKILKHFVQLPRQDQKAPYHKINISLTHLVDHVFA